MRIYKVRGRSVSAAILLALSLAVLSARELYAQANAGLTGTVTDSSGAVVAGANVTITNQGTGIQSHTTTSSAGTYAVTGLTPGQYSLTIEGSGFKKFVLNSINIEVSTTSTMNA